METVFVRSILLGFCVGLVWTAIWSAVLHFRGGHTSSSPYLLGHSQYMKLVDCDARRGYFRLLLRVNRVLF